MTAEPIVLSPLRKRNAGTCKLAWQQQQMHHKQQLPSDSAVRDGRPVVGPNSRSRSVNFSTEHGGITLSGGGNYSADLSSNDMLSTNVVAQQEEFEALKCILLRESYLRRLQDVVNEQLKKFGADASRGRVAGPLRKVSRSLLCSLQQAVR
jgi:hypothetical protein